MRTLLFPVLLLLGACVNEENYLERYLETQCAAQERCAQEDFSDLYDDVDQCADDQKANANLLDTPECLAECSFDGDAAKECIKALEDLSCSGVNAHTIPDPCKEVYDCGVDADVGCQAMVFLGQLGS